VAGAVAGVVRAVASVVVAIADEDVVDVDQICTSFMAVAVKLLTSVVQVIWLIVNKRPSAIATESGMMTILLAWEVVRTPPTWRATVNETWSVVESPSLVLVINDTKLLMPCVKCFELGISNTCDEGVRGKEWCPQDHKEMVHGHEMTIMVEMHII
jgi:ABC-type xylose transport system permease subunit